MRTPRRSPPAAPGVTGLAGTHDTETAGAAPHGAVAVVAAPAYQQAGSSEFGRCMLLLLRHLETAAGIDQLPGQPPGLLGGEKDDDVRDVLGRAKPP